MSITDELRDCIRTANRSYEDARNHYNDREILHIPEEELTAIADRIDAEHAKAVERAYGDGVMSVPIALDESQWVKLPVDADGVPIHVGDVMDVGIVFAIGDEGVFMVENGFSGRYDVECFDGFACHHVKPDSWERIIADAMSDEAVWFKTHEEWQEYHDQRLAELVERCRRLAGERG